MLPQNKKLKQSARNLRKNMTNAERKLWSKIRKKQLKGVQFYRQKVIGNYIVDFYCHQVKLVIEVDGGQHFCKPGIKTDLKRDTYFKELNLRVLRFSNYEVLKEIDSVIDKIYTYL